jgi:hypothetical protein
MLARQSVYQFSHSGGPFVLLIFEVESHILPGLASNYNTSDLCLQTRYYYRHEPPMSSERRS